MLRKITVGFVIQEFDENGKCRSQTFVAGDQVDWEDEMGDPADPPEGVEYFPFEMKQPE